MVPYDSTHKLRNFIQPSLKHNIHATSRPLTIKREPNEATYIALSVLPLVLSILNIFICELTAHLAIYWTVDHETVLLSNSL